MKPFTNNKMVGRADVIRYLTTLDEATDEDMTKVTAYIDIFRKLLSDDNDTHIVDQLLFMEGKIRKDIPEADKDELINMLIEVKFFS